MSTSSQKFIARNRAPRVQIEYDVETFGAQKKVNLPFVMGVMADLAGKSETDEAKKAVGDRKFLEIDVDNFDSRMKAMKPRVAFQVPNTLTGEGNISLDITFDMDSRPHQGCPIDGRLWIKCDRNAVHDPAIRPDLLDWPIK